MDVTNVDYQHLTEQKKSNKVNQAPIELENCCPVKDILARFGDKWSMYAILKLGNAEKLRFNELRAQISGVSQRMLTVTLRSLEEDGLVLREQFPEIPPRVEYSLTPLGRSLLVQLLQLAEWANLNLDQILEARKRYSGKE